MDTPFYFICENLDKKNFVIKILYSFLLECSPHLKNLRLLDQILNITVFLKFHHIANLK